MNVLIGIGALFTGISIGFGLAEKDRTDVKIASWVALIVAVGFLVFGSIDMPL